MVAKLTKTPIKRDNNQSIMSLEVGGFDYKNWKAISISRSMTDISGSFSFTTSNLFPGDNVQWRITRGSACKVKVNNFVLLTGYVDSVEVSYDADNFNLTFSGRDNTADLVDCSVGVDNVGTLPTELINLSAFQIIQNLCQPFGITVLVEDSNVTTDLQMIIPKFTIDPGAKVFELISEICQQFAVLPISNRIGQLKLVRAGLVPAFSSLKGGVNVLSAKLSIDDSNRFSTYYIKGVQQQNTAFTTPTPIKGELADSFIRRYRPMVVNVGKSAVTDEICQTRAAWEARVRAGSSTRLELLLQGWLQENGTPWEINDLVQYEDTYLGIRGEYLISSLNFELSESGELTSLVLVPTDTFTLLKRVPVPNEAKTAFDVNREVTLGNV